MMIREPDASDEFIAWLFRELCVKCGHQYRDINEIVPRARGPESLTDWKNRVTMCAICHDDYHRHGVSDEAIAELRQIRIEFLIAIGRQEYAEA